MAAEALGVRYGSRTALGGVSLEVRPGTHTAVVGPNGSGKSSLLLALKGVVRPSEGRVVLEGEPLGGIDPRVGLVLANPEDQGVAPVVEDDVAFGLEYLGLPPAELEERVRESLRTVGLLECRARPVHTLSGGQLQKLALASVWALGCRYLLLDEATSMLSPWERDSLMSVLSSLGDQGVGVVHVTHQAEDLLWADRVLALDGGEVVFYGTVEGFFAWPGCPWEKPLVQALVEHLDAQEMQRPSYPELVAWLGGGR